MTASRFPPSATDGIVAHLGPAVAVFARGALTADARTSRTNVAVLAHDTVFCSLNAPDQFIAYDFGASRSVVPTDYAIRSCRNPPGRQHLRSWVLEVTSGVDGTWLEIDERRDDCQLNGIHKTAYFKVRRESTDAFRCIRIRQTGPNWNGENYLQICGFEVFGELQTCTP
jgi:hypothetical protein